MMYGWAGNGIGGWIAMALVMMLFWGAVITVVILLVRGNRGPGGGGSHGHVPDDAERILNERFARGEIDETELNARRTALRRRT
ncbi:SHOCT domain-containing protein [Pseudarthrobacter sp. P1]|uniref:SHOCT domain-containing protein n=1 Tax=Pseudarthrobacter sp. P1 TaxID=3418418 RepID=UPI003CEB1113